MKINTKKTTPVSKTVSPVIMKNDNKNIPKSRLDEDDDHDGRQVMYEPTVVFTPVLSSDRTHRASPDRPRFSLNAMEEVCSMLMKMFIKEAAAGEKTADKKEEETKEETNEKLGRVKVSVTSPKSNTSVEVLRSARLVEPCKN